MAVSNAQRISFHYPYSGFQLSQRNRLKEFLRHLFRSERTPLEALSFVFCSDEFLLGINQSHLQHDTYTDIITFPLSETGAPVIGEIYISVERVRENSRTFNTSFSLELHRVIFHGALHLCGYRDKTKREAAQMRAKEDEYLGKYFVPRGTHQV